MGRQWELVIACLHDEEEGDGSDMLFATLIRAQGLGFSIFRTALIAAFYLQIDEDDAHGSSSLLCIKNLTMV